MVVVKVYWNSFIMSGITYCDFGLMNYILQPYNRERKIQFFKNNYFLYRYINKTNVIICISYLTIELPDKSKYFCQ